VSKIQRRMSRVQVPRSGKMLLAGEFSLEGDIPGVITIYSSRPLERSLSLIFTGRKDEVFSHARPEPSEAYEPELSISNRT
jgi:hypothetical protein